MEHQWSIARKGVILECPQNALFHDLRDIIIPSQMAISQISLMVANVGTSLFFILNPSEIIHYNVQK